MAKLNTLHMRLRRFADDECGTVTIEAVMILPMLFWCIVSMYGYWDVFRVNNTFQKATHTVSNIISRTKKSTALSEADMRGYYDMINYLMNTDEGISIRITEYTYYDAGAYYHRNWSCSMGKLPELTDADLAVMKTRLPLLKNGDVHVMLEARYDYDPPFDVSFMYMDMGSIEEMELKEMVIDRPRDGDFDLPAGECPTI